VFAVNRELASITALATCDNKFTLFVNGKQVASGDEWASPSPSI